MCGASPFRGAGPGAAAAARLIGAGHGRPRQTLRAQLERRGAVDGLHYARRALERLRGARAVLCWLPNL